MTRLGLGVPYIMGAPSLFALNSRTAVGEGYSFFFFAIAFGVYSWPGR